MATVVITIRTEDEAEFLVRWKRYADSKASAMQDHSLNSELLNPIKAGPTSRKRIKYMEVDRTFLAHLRLDGFLFE